MQAISQCWAWPIIWKFHLLQEGMVTLFVRDLTHHTPLLTSLAFAQQLVATLVAGPLITTLTTNSCTLKRRRRNHHNHSNLAQINWVSDLHQTTTAILIWLCARWMLALLPTNLRYYIYQWNADLFVKNEILLSDNDPVICNAIASPGFKVFSFPKSTREGGGTLLLFIYLFFQQLYWVWLI